MSTLLGPDQLAADYQLSAIRSHSYKRDRPDPIILNIKSATN